MGPTTGFQLPSKAIGSGVVHIGGETQVMGIISKRDTSLARDMKLTQDAERLTRRRSLIPFSRLQTFDKSLGHCLSGGRG